MNQTGCAVMCAHPVRDGDDGGGAEVVCEGAAQPRLHRVRQRGRRLVQDHDFVHA